jgi:hypothetical protein
MRYRLGQTVLSVVVTILLSLGTIPVLAQDKLTEKYTFESGATFNYPKEWKLTEKSTPLLLLSEQTRLFVLDYGALQAIGVDIKNDSQNDILKTYFTKAYPDRAFKEVKIETLEIGKRKGIQYDYSLDDGRARIMVIPFTNGSAGIVEEISLAGKLREEDTVIALVESFNNSEKITGSTNTSIANQTVNCTISTTRDNTVHVRVGPGENRTAIVFLSAGSSYRVLGQAKAKDGSQWWKLDKNEVAPDKAANEVWVKQVDVKATGDCDKVTDVNAPPVVPIVNAPPSAPPVGNDTGSSNPPPSGGGGNTPLSGTWTVNFGDGKESCTDISNFDFMPAARQDIFNVVAASSSLIYVDGGPLVRNGNTFSGAYDLVDNQGATFNRKLILQVNSPTEMSGTLIDTATVEGHLCSATLPINMTKN